MNSFGFGSSPLIVRLANNEKGYYSNLHQQADPHDTNKIGGADAVQFFKRSGLHVDELKKIWLISSSNGETLNREEFYVALKLISYAQNGIEVSKDSIQRNTPSPLPKFHTKTEDVQPAQVNEEVYRIHSEQEKKYQVYVKQLDPYNSNFIQTTLALELFQKSQLPDYAIQGIMNMVESGLQSKLKITVQQYTVIVHLISLNRQGVILPTQLPIILSNYLHHNQSESPVLNKPDSFSDFGQFGTFQSTATNRSNSTNDLLDFDGASNDAKSVPKQIVDKCCSAFDEVPKIDPEPAIKQEQVNHSKTHSINQISLPYPTIYKDDHKPPMPQRMASNGSQLQASEEANKSHHIDVQSLQQIKLIQNDFAKQLQASVKQAQVDEVYQSIQSNAVECSQILQELRAQNEQMLQEKDQEVQVLETLNDQYRTIVQKFRDEADDLQSEMKDMELRRKQAIHQITNTVNDLNQQLGLNLRTRQEKQRKSSSISEDISTYSSSMLVDIGKSINLERQQRQQIDENFLKELKEQKILIQGLEKQIKKMSTPSKKIDYKTIDKLPIEMTYEPSEESNVQGERDQFTPHVRDLRRGSQQVSNIFQAHEPIKSVQVRTSPAFMDFPQHPHQQVETQQQVSVLETSLPMDMESQSAPLKSLYYSKQESVTTPQLQPVWNKQQEPEWTNKQEPVWTNKQELVISQPEVEDNDQTWALKPSETEGDNPFDDMGLEKSISANLQQTPKSTEYDDTVQIELDLTHQFGPTVQWNDFDSNYTQAFGQPDQVVTEGGFGFGVPNKDKTDDFDAFKW